MTDGSGHDWPLYAKVNVDGPAPDTYTDPSTGQYSIEPARPGRRTRCTVDAQYPGYVPQTREVTVGDGDADAGRRARGRQHHLHGPGLRVQLQRRVTEDFDGDDAARGLDDRGQHRQRPGLALRRPGEPRQPHRWRPAAFAIMDSDYYGSGGRAGHVAGEPGDRHVVADRPGGRVQAGLQQPRRHRRRRRQRRRRRRPGRRSCTRPPTSADRARTCCQLPMAAGQPDVQVRFHHYDAELRLVVGGRRRLHRQPHLRPDRPAASSSATCAAATGPAGINGATVTSLDNAGGEGRHGRHPGRRSARRRLLLDVLVPDGTAPVRGHGQAVHVADEAGERRRRLGDRPANFRARRRPPDRDADQPVDDVGPRWRRRSRRRSPSPTTGTPRSRSSSARRAGGFVMQTRRRQPDQRRQDRRPGRAHRCSGSRRDVSFARGSVREGRHRLAGCRRPARSEAPWTDIADYPATVMDNRVVYVDGVAYSIAGGNGSASTPRSRPTTRPRSRGRRRPSLPGARNAMSVGAVDGQIVATGGWAAAGPSPDTWIYDPAGDAWTAGADAPVSAVGLGPGGRRRQAVRRRRLHDRGLHADVERRGGVRPGDRQLGTAGGLPGLGGVRVLRRHRRDGLLHRRQRRRRGDRGQLRLRPGGRHLDPDRGRAGRHVGQLVRRRQRHARRQRRRAGRRRSPTRTFAYDPASDAWADLPNSNTARYRGGMACGLSTRSAARPAASPPRSTARCCPGSRTAAAPAPTSSG